MAFYCGNPICKKPVEIVLNGVTPWPTRCKGCGLSLYPEDILETSSREELEMRPGVLMWEKGGQRVAVQSADLRKRGASGERHERQGDEPSVDDVLAMVDLGEEAKPVRAESSSTRMWIAAAVVVAVIVAAVVLLTR